MPPTPLEDADPPGGARSVRPDDDRAAARLRRPARPRDAAAPALDARSAWTSRSTPSERRRTRIAIGACRIINIKPGRVGGHGPSIQLHDLAARHGVPVWHGGMLESGIGRAHNIHLSTLPNFTLPGRRGRKPAILCPRS